MAGFYAYTNRAVRAAVRLLALVAGEGMRRGPIVKRALAGSPIRVEA
jgi:hypothetical protein